MNCELLAQAETESNSVVLVGMRVEDLLNALSPSTVSGLGLAAVVERSKHRAPTRSVYNPSAATPPP